MPRPGTPVIHPGMLDQIRPVAVGGETGTCRLLAAPITTLNPTTLAYDESTPVVLWTGACRIQPRSTAGNDERDAAGEQVSVPTYQVTVPIDAEGVRADRLVEVLTSSDAELVGLRLRVVTVRYGDYQLERNLDCELADS